ncbi:MAG TPA: alpha/beta hydrolase [Actinomycetota bacterium]|nr:alpha/beta hydrolase [Actinomycetota bacterium]
MPQLVTEDVTLHVDVDGAGLPVSVLAHGLMNSCRELAAITPLVPGTKVRFCFRGHGHSSSPERGYRFADFARDVEAVADAYEATVAFGTSLGAGAIGHLLTLKPDRFDKLVFLLPAGLDQPFQYKQRMLHTAGLVDGKSVEEAIEAITSDPGRTQAYLDLPWLRDFDRQMLQELNPVGVPRAIREVIEDWPLEDREQMRKVTAPTLLICREGDEIHPAEVGRILAEVMPNAELLLFRDGAEMYQAIPQIVAQVREFILS